MRDRIIFLSEVIGTVFVLIVVAMWMSGEPMTTRGVHWGTAFILWGLGSWIVTVFILITLQSSKNFRDWIDNNADDQQ